MPYKTVDKDMKLRSFNLGFLTISTIVVDACTYVDVMSEVKHSEAY